MPRVRPIYRTRIPVNNFCVFPLESIRDVWICKERTSQANWPWNYFRRIPTYVITIPRRHGHWTDGQTTYLSNTVLCVASRGTKCKYIFVTVAVGRWQSICRRRHQKTLQRQREHHLYTINDTSSSCSRFNTGDNAQVVAVVVVVVARLNAEVTIDNSVPY